MKSFRKNQSDTSLPQITEIQIFSKDRYSFKCFETLNNEKKLTINFLYKLDDMGRLIFQSQFYYKYPNSSYKSIHTFQGDTVIVNSFSYKVDYWEKSSEIIEIENSNTINGKWQTLNKTIIKTMYIDGRKTSPFSYDITQKYKRNSKGCVTRFSESGYSIYTLKIK